MQVYEYQAIAVETFDKELTKATLVEEDRRLQHVEEGNLLDLDFLSSKTSDARDRSTPFVTKTQPTHKQPEESLDELTYSLINEIATHQLEVYLDQVTQKLHNAHYVIVREAKALLADVTDMVTSTRHTEHPPSERTAEFRQRAEAIKQNILQLSSVACKKADELRSTSGSQSGSDGTSLSPIVDAKLTKQPWSTCIGGGGGAALTLLSDIYLSIKAIEHGGRDDEEVWVAPQAFERATQKFWVKEEHLTEVMLACVSEVPLLVYGKSGRLHEDHEDVEPDVDLWKSHVATISSVYFDSPSLDLYKGRIARIEGAKLVRVRWYGSQPKGQAVVFLELKTHHESWVEENSCKQRVAVQEKDMVHVMSTIKIWTVDFAESIVRAGNPKMDKKALHDATNLLLQIHDLVVEFDLRPCVRTCYRRAAFQSSTSNELRLTIDRDITMTDERSAPRGAWCLPHQGNVTLAPTAKVPVAVFEVKLAGSDRPAFMDRLIDSGIVRDGYKFSKFLTGVATFHASSDTLAVLPYWADDPLFAHMFHIEPAALDTSLRSETTTPPFVQKHSESTLSTLAEESDSARTISRESRRRWVWSVKRQKKKRMASSNRVKIEPKTYFAAERTFIQWISAALMLITVAAILLSFSTADGMESGYAAGLTLTILAIVVTLYALVIYFRRLYLLERGQAYGYSDHMGPPILAIAIAAGIGAAIYAAASRHRSTDVSVSTAALIAEPGRCMRHDFHGISLLEYQPSDVVYDAVNDALIIPSQSKITSIPLDMPESPHEISVLAELAGYDMESVAYVNGTLFALAEDKDISTLLAFEWKHNVFNKENTLQLVGRWKLKGTENAEGIVYLPNLGGNGPRLLVSADGATTADGVASNILVFDIPTTSNALILDGNIAAEGILSPNYQLNAGIFTSGIAGDSKIAAMTYFEDVLYVLHDNARVIRGWDIASATMVSEWITPRAGGQYDKQWEGLTLQRAGDFSIVAHMTLDTPPQIWSFVMEQSLNGGTTSLSFPLCAQAF